MLFKKTQSLFIVLVLMGCGCHSRQASNMPTSSNSGGRQNSHSDRSAVTVYYFHRTARCFSCLTIEANAAKVVKDNFSQSMADGTLIWVPFNLDDPGGEEFSEEFDLTTSTLVLARTTDDNHVRYKKLEEVWRLLGDPEGFSEYVTKEINEFMKMIIEE